MLRGALSKKTTGTIAKDAPTAENLRRLNTKTGGGSVGPRSDGGKSARRSEISISRFSRTSGNQEPVDPYKDHSVEQMDVLIAQVTTEINKLAFKKKNAESDGYATKSTIKAKVKPILEEMN